MKNLLACSVFLFALSSCATPEAADGMAAATVNSVCVISGEKLDAGAPSVDYAGVKVGFCCKNCLGKWQKMDEAAKKAAFDALPKN